MTIALQPPPLNTPPVDQNGQVNALWGRYYIDMNQTVTLDCAPADARYIVATANPSLTAEVNLGALTAGHISITVAAGVAAVSSSATIPSADLTGALPALDGSALTALNASAISSGTLPDARLGSPLPVLSGVNLTNLTSGNLVGALPAISGSALTALNAAVLSGALPALNAAALTSLTSTNIVHQVVTKVFADSPYMVLATDFTVLVDATAGAVTVTLPTPTSGRILCVKKTDASANAVTLTGTVDGVVNPTLAVQYNSVLAQGDGSTWNALARI